MTGRRTSLTPEVRQAILDAIALGAKYQDAAAYAGVTEASLYNWLRRGREESARLDALVTDDNPDPQPSESEAVFLEFFEAARRANGKLAVTVTGNWQKALKGNPSAARDFMRYRFPHWNVAEGEGAEDGDELQTAALTAAQGRTMAGVVQAVLDSLELTPAQRKEAALVAREALTGGNPAIETRSREAS